MDKELENKRYTTITHARSAFDRNGNSVVYGHVYGVWDNERNCEVNLGGVKLLNYQMAKEKAIEMNNK